MKDKFEILNDRGVVTVFGESWKGNRGVAAEFHESYTSAELAQEVYELLAAIGMEVKFVEG